MKILWFTNIPCGASEVLFPQLYLGGWMTALEKHLVNRSDIELVVCFYWNKQLAPFKHNKTRYIPVYRSAVGHKISQIASRYSLFRGDEKKQIQQLTQVVEQERPDIVHIHGTEENFGLIQSSITTPTVLSVQGILSSYSEKFFSGISFFEAYCNEGILPKIRFTSIRSAHKNMRMAAAREQKILLQTRYVLGRTDWDKRVTSILAPEAKYFVFEDMLRPLFYTNEWTKASFNKQFTIVSILTEGLYKGIESIIKTAKILHSRSVNFSWIVIGQKANSPAVRIAKKWLKTDLEKLHVKIVGSKSEQDVVDTMLSADVYCHPSHIENNPNSLCEAMMLGMPVIATAAGGTLNLFQNSDTGILLQDGDAYSMAGAILEVQNNFDKAQSRGKRARQQALVKHNPDSIVSNLLSTYQFAITAQKKK